MAETQTVRRRATGLFTHPNELEVPPGSLLVADNAVIDREWVIQKRRGVKRYGTALNGPAAALFEFKNRLVLLDGDRLKYDSDGQGTWVAWPGNTLQPSATTRIRAVETAGVLLYPTFFGPYRQDSLTGTPRRAGMPEAIDYEVSKIGTGGIGSFLLVDSAVAYRILWGREDTNKNIITGAPSHQERVVNTKAVSLCILSLGVVTVTKTAHGYATGDLVEISAPSNSALESGEKTITVTTANTFTYTVADAVTVLVGASVTVGKRFNVRLVFTVPPGIQAGDFWEIYRTTGTAGAGVDPGETYKRVKKETYTAGSTITFDDDIPETQLDLPLYTNDTEEGPGQRNDRPPFCRYMAFFKTHVFYAFAKQEEAVDLTLEEITGIVNGDTITISFPDPLVYTFAAAENQAARQFKLFTLSDPETPTEAQAVERTMKSFQKIVNRDTQSRATVYYTSGSDEAPGKITIRAKDLNSDPFTVTSNVTRFDPDISTLTTSSADLQENAIYRSKSGQPDHVPRLNRHLIGRKNKKILGILSNRDALFVLKEDGLFTITGESDGGPGFAFIVDERDPTTVLKGLNTLVGLDNALYAMTTQGGMRLTQASSSVFSRSVEIDVNLLGVLGLFEEETYGIAYESDRKYFLCVPGDAVWVYNYLTNAWTRWLLQASLGHVLLGEDRLYLAHSREPYILQERKNLSFDGRDQQDEDLDVTVTALSTTTYQSRTVSLVTVTHTYYRPPAAGWFFTQGQYEARVVAVETLSATSFRLTLWKNLTALTASAAVLSQPVPLRVAWTPETVGSAGTIKQFSGLQVYSEEDAARNSRLGFLADTRTSFEYLQATVITNTEGWGQRKWGRFPWGSPRSGRSTPIRTFVPQDHQRCRGLTLVYENTVAREQVSILEVAYDVRPFGTRSERQPS